MSYFTGVKPAQSRWPSLRTAGPHPARGLEHERSRKPLDVNQLSICADEHRTRTLSHKTDLHLAARLEGQASRERQVDGSVRLDKNALEAPDGVATDAPGDVGVSDCASAGWKVAQRQRRDVQPLRRRHLGIVAGPRPEERGVVSEVNRLLGKYLRFDSHTASFKPLVAIRGIAREAPYLSPNVGTGALEQTSIDLMEDRETGPSVTL